MTKIITKSNIKPNASAEEIFQNLLVYRGYKTKTAQAAFLHPGRPSLKSLVTATGLKLSDLKSIRVLLDTHLASGHDLCVFGDYDADGISATAVLWQALVKYAEGKTSRILPFIPDRQRHGYGLSETAVKEILHGSAFKTTKFPDFLPSLIITVDNGIVANSAVSYLRKSGIDVILTDHHQPDVLPDANIILHTTATSGAGLAWILALYLLKEDQFSQSLIDLATIGIIADLMPLTGLNRGIVVHGLHVLSHAKRPGLSALYLTASLKSSTISAYTVGYQLAPRLNAAGRLHDPYDALRLLCATSAATALPLAEKINSHNLERQTLTDAAITKASQTSSTHKIVIVAGPYHEGIIGLVAGKLVETTGKPAVVMSVKDNLIKGSVRSIPGVNITKLLRSLSVPFLGLGGHPQAGGFSLDPANLDLFTAELENLADSVILDEFLEKKIHVDLELSLAQISLLLTKLLGSLEPFGLGNPKPKFLFRDLVVIEDHPLGVGDKHHKLTVEQNGKTAELLLFNTQHAHPLKSISSLVANLDLNVWNGRERVQLIGSYVAV